MNILNTLKLDSWWSVALWCGVALFAVGLIFEIDVVNRKHLIGLGFGMFLMGISCFAALRYLLAPNRAGTACLEGNVVRREGVTALLFGIGALITIVFSALLLWGLIK
jgi:hypothetical protein